MAPESSRRSLLVILSVLSIVICLTYFLSILARGYQPDFNHGLHLKATGLLSTISKPKSASIFIDDQLVSTTDSTLNLTPSTYHLTIAKDGYSPWTKTISIQKEMVTLIEAILFRSSPSITESATTQATTFAVSPDRNYLAFTSSTGLFLVDTSASPLSLGKNTPKLISPSPQVNWSSFSLTFSPNSHQILAKSPSQNVSYLINLDSLNPNPQAVSPTQINQLDWPTQQRQLALSQLNKLPLSIQPQVATSSATIVFSEDDTKALYSKVDQIYYTYDFDKNIEYQLGPVSSISSPFWLPSTHNLIFTNPQQQIEATDFDGTNHTVLYSGYFSPNSIVPWSDGTKLFFVNHQKLFSLTIR